MYKYRVVGGGSHEQDDVRTGKNRVYQSGEVVLSRVRLDEIMINKFERLQDVSDEEALLATGVDPDSRIAPARPDTFGDPKPPEAPPRGTAADRELYESMTVQELRAHADGEEIDLGGARSKEAIIAKLLGTAAGGHG